MVTKVVRSKTSKLVQIYLSLTLTAPDVKLGTFARGGGSETDTPHITPEPKDSQRLYVLLELQFDNLENRNCYS